MLVFLVFLVIFKEIIKSKKEKRSACLFFLDEGQVHPTLLLQ
jgi:hypothetical protein